MPTRTLAAIDYPASDGRPMAETDYHINLILDTRQRLKDWFGDRDDVYVAGNLFVYYEEGQPNRSLAPDGFVAFGVPNRLRETYKVWEEGVFPSVVFEFTSKSTQAEDLGVKLKIYRDIWKVKEYFLFDPYEEYLNPSFYGLRRSRNDFAPIAPVRGRLASKVLGVSMERDGKMIRFFDSATGRPLLTESEREAERANRRADASARRAQEAARRAEEAARRASELGAALSTAQSENERLQAELDAIQSKIAKNGHANGDRR